MPFTTEQVHAVGWKSGRPKGRKNRVTILQEVAKKKFDQKVLRLQSRLLNSQASRALGQQFLYKIEKEFVATGVDKDGEQKGYWKNLVPKLVDKEDEIFEYLEKLAENNGAIDDENDPATAYYYLTSKEPDNNAIDSLLDRVHGKAKQSVHVDGEIKFSLIALAQKRKALLEQNNIIDANVVEQKALDVEKHADE